MRNLQITPTIANRDTPSVEKYFSEIGRESLISAQEEVSLTAMIRKGDKIAGEKQIITYNITAKELRI
jgi:RNA polymerase primary sigma factor